MAKSNAPKSHLPEGFEPVRSARSAGFYVTKPGNACRGMLVDVIETDDPFKKGAMRTFFKVQLTAGGTTIRDAETDKERDGEEGEIIGVDEKGYLRALREKKGHEVFFICTGQQEKKDVKKGRSPAWIFEVGAVPF